MQHFNKRLIVCALALVVAGGVSLSGSALAENNGGQGTSNSSSTSGGGSATSTGPNSGKPLIRPPVTAPTPMDPAKEAEIHDKANTLVQQFMMQSQAKVATQAKNAANPPSQANIQKSCEARKTALTNRMNNAVKAAQRHQQVFDSLYTKIKAFYVSKNLSVTNYSDLTAKADAAQADAAAKITALQNLNFTVDCTQTGSLATNVSAFQAAVGAARDSLKAYRQALVNLITAIQGASTANTSGSSTTGTNNSSNTTQ